MPIVVLGDIGGAAIANCCKDSWIRQSQPDRAIASNQTLNVYDDGAADKRYALLRFGLTTAGIPPGSTIKSAILTITLDTNSTGIAINDIYRLNVPWGITPLDEGATENPATGGQATWQHSFDTNGGADVNWTGANFVLAADAGALLNTWNIAALDLAGQPYNVNITPGVALDFLNDVTNYGYVIFGAGATAIYASRDNPTAARRPYLTIDYTVPGSTIKKIWNRKKFGRNSSAWNRKTFNRQ